MANHSTGMKIATYSLLTVGGIFMFYPILYAFLVSLMDPYEYTTVNSLFPVASHPDFTRYADIFRIHDVVLWFRNTIVRVAWYMVWTVATSLILGYFFAKGKFYGKKVMFYLLLSTMMIPAVTTMVPLYVMYARWPWAGGNDIFFGGHGLLNSWGVMLLPGLVQVYSVFLVKQMYETLPNDYEESARMDGAGTFRIIFQIFAPMLKPVIAVILINDFVGIWNDFMTNLIYTNSGGPNITMIAFGITKLPGYLTQQDLSNNYVIDYPTLFAAALLATLPTIALFLFLQKQIVQGLSMSGLKG